MSARAVVVLLSVCFFLPGSVRDVSSTPAAAATVALPDTGLFAPVAAQLRARDARLADKKKSGAERVGLLLATGRNEDAAREAAKLRGKPRDPLAPVPGEPNGDAKRGL